MTAVPTLGKPYRRAQDGLWIAPYSIAGRRGTTSAKTRAEAVHKRARAVQRALAGAPLTDSKVVLSAYAERWIATSLKASGRKQSTVALYAGTLNRHVIPILGHLQLSRVTAQAIEALLVTLKPGTARTAYAAMRAMFATAKRDNLVATNPVELLKAPRTPRSEAAFLDDGQISAVVQAVQGDRLESLYLLLLATGLRRGEALALRWADLDGEVLHVRRTLSRIEGVGLVESEPKSTASRRDLVIGPTLLRELDRHRARQAAERLAVGSAWIDLGLMFSTTIGTHLEPRNVLRDFQGLTRAGGLGSVKLHTLRHSAASAMLAGGIDLAAVSEHLGHGSKAVTLGIYSHALPARRAEASALLDAQIG